MDEMARAIAGLKDDKVPGGDGIPAEVWKHGGDNLSNRLHQLITKAWEEGSVPQAWKDCNHLQERRSNRLWELQRNLSSFHSRQDLRQDPAQQTIYSHNTRSSSGDTVWLQIQPEHSGYDILSPTTTRKVH